MSTARRREILQVLGVDLYERRPAAGTPVEPPLHAAVTIEGHSDLAADPLPSAAAPATAKAPSSRARKSPSPAPAVAEVASVYNEQPLALNWWQFEDLLILEEIPSTAVDAAELQRLASAIAAALGRQSGVRGELRWPPGGDFRAMSLHEFLHHFVQGRAEGQAELHILVTSERVQQSLTAQTASIATIPALAAMLVDASLKVQAWQTLKPLMR